MKYYHGTIHNFKDFDLKFAYRCMDFGAGIYLTQKESHAKSIALKGNSQQAYIRTYDLDINELRKRFNILEFKKASIPWVKFVLENRNELLKPEYDIVIGATADARTQYIINEFNAFCKHIKPREPNKTDYKNLIKRLMPENFPVQMCILSQNALDYVNRHLVSVSNIRKGGN